ncbi:short chain dehydrogenase, partial [Paraphysoderma sedebokerense]
MSLRNKVLFISGASRGIGKAIALRAAKDGAKIAIAAKTTEPHPKLPGTIFTAAEEIKAAGGDALPIVCDIRSEEQVKEAIQKTVDKWGGIDILVNNASAINLTGTEETSVKKFDLMHQINLRGTWMVTKYALPHLRNSKHAHVLNLSPPLFMSPRWFAPHTAYTIAKYGMSLCVLGMAEEFKQYKVAVNALWPRTVIETAAMQAIGLADQESSKKMRRPEIMADAAYTILSQDPSYTGNFCIDEDVLFSQGFTESDLSKVYACKPGTPSSELLEDFF